MIQDIKYGGCSANPPDYSAPDGDMALSVGLVPEDGALRPVLQPRVVFNAGSGRSVIFVHETNSFRHYIVNDTASGSLYWVDAGGDTSVSTLLLAGYGELYQVNAVGNTLVALTSGGMRYMLWKASDGGHYKDLGTGLPEIPVSFGLQETAASITSNSFSVQMPHQVVDGKLEDMSRPEYAQENRTAITNAVLAKVNKAIAEIHKSGRFIYPFFVRYAFRLFDGSLTMHSAPVLMPCTTAAAPLVPVTVPDGSYTEFTAAVSSFCCRLDYSVMAKNATATPEQTKNLLLEYKDIITSVDIFISAPIYTYDQNGECDMPCTGAALSRVYTLSKSTGLTYAPYNWRNIVDDTLNYVPLPARKQEDVYDDIRNCYNFYLLKSIPVNDLATKRTVIDIPEDYLTSLAARELMTDDYDSHDTLVPKHSYVYNSRLNLTDISKQYFGGFDPVSMFCYAKTPKEGEVALTEDPRVSTRADGESDASDAINIPICYIYIQDPSNGDITVVPDNRNGVYEFNPGNPLLYMFYPNINASKAQLHIAVGENSWRVVEVKLSQHDFLNGAYYFGGWEGIDTETGSIIDFHPHPGFFTVDIESKIYTSEVNNPFFFPVTGINTVGTGRVLGISSAARALSQGQFGQFPLYAFTTDGVWALEVSATGTYSARQPITRDVCIDPDSITQLDSSVLFATDRGIMFISGSESTCVSDVINSPDMFALSSLPCADALLGRYNGLCADSLQAADLSLSSFGQFLSGCRMVYDYVHQRVIVYNPQVLYAYVFSLKSGAWGMMRSTIASNVNSYPEALAMDHGGNLVDFSASDASAAPVFAVTRPFKLGYPDVLKTIDTIIQRGRFENGRLAQVLYGSRDLRHWHTVWSSTDSYLRGFRGSPYKYFRLLLVGSLADDESLHGCTAQFTMRLANHPR